MTAAALDAGVLDVEEPRSDALDPLPGVLDDVGSALDEGGIDHAVIGGVASSIHGRPRTTKDIDVFLKPRDADSALELLEARNFDVERTDPKWIFKARKRGVQVDIIFSTRIGVYFDEEMLGHSRFMTYRGTRVRVISPEDLLVIKAIAHDEATPRHWFDALGVIVGSELDWDYLIERARRGQRRVLSLLLYAQSLDYAVPDRVIRTLAQRICDS